MKDYMLDKIITSKFATCLNSQKSGKCIVDAKIICKTNKQFETITNKCIELVKKFAKENQGEGEMKISNTFIT